MGRPTQHNHPPLGQSGPRGEGQNDTRPLCDTRIPHPPLGRGHDQARQAWRRPQRQGHARTFPFPNPEAKTASADGTAPARVWESRTPPPAHHKRGGPATGPPFLLAHTGHTRPCAHTEHPRTGHREHPPRTRGHTRTATVPPHTRPHTQTQHEHTHKHSMSTRTATPATVNTRHTQIPKTTPTTKFATPHRLS